MTYSMARRKDLPYTLSKLHPTFCTPYYAIWIIGLLMAGLVLFIDHKQIKHKIISILGLSSCLIMLFFIFFISPEAWLFGSLCLIFGTCYYGVKKWHKRKKIET